MILNLRNILLLGLCVWWLCITVALDEDEYDSKPGKMFNFASQAAGAVVLAKSPTSGKGFNNLLNDDKDKYGISPCAEKKWMVIGLSEDILVTQVAIANYEKYSSMLKDFQLMASTSYPTDDWIDLGTYQALPKLGEQLFEIPQTPSSPHTRYLKFKFQTHYGSEELCTLSQIKVHGKTVIASFQEEVKRSDHIVKNMLDQLASEDASIDDLEEMNESEFVTIDELGTNASMDLSEDLSTPLPSPPNDTDIHSNTDANESSVSDDFQTNKNKIPVRNAESISDDSKGNAAQVQIDVDTEANATTDSVAPVIDETSNIHQNDVINEAVTLVQKDGSDLNANADSIESNTAETNENLHTEKAVEFENTGTNDTAITEVNRTTELLSGHEINSSCALNATTHNTICSNLSLIPSQNDSVADNSLHMECVTVSLPNILFNVTVSTNVTSNTITIEATTNTSAVNETSLSDSSEQRTTKSTGMGSLLDTKIIDAIINEYVAPFLGAKAIKSNETETVEDTNMMVKTGSIITYQNQSNVTEVQDSEPLKTTLNEDNQHIADAEVDQISSHDDLKSIDTSSQPSLDPSELDIITTSSSSDRVSDLSHHDGTDALIDSSTTSLNQSIDSNTEIFSTASESNDVSLPKELIHQETVDIITNESRATHDSNYDPEKSPDNNQTESFESHSGTQFDISHNWLGFKYVSKESLVELKSLLSCQYDRQVKIVLSRHDSNHSDEKQLFVINSHDLNSSEFDLIKIACCETAESIASTDSILSGVELTMLEDDVKDRMIDTSSVSFNELLSHLLILSEHCAYMAFAHSNVTDPQLSSLFKALVVKRDGITVPDDSYAPPIKQLETVANITTTDEVIDSRNATANTEQPPASLEYTQHDVHVPTNSSQDSNQAWNISDDTPHHLLSNLNFNSSSSSNFSATPADLSSPTNRTNNNTSSSRFSLHHPCLDMPKYQDFKKKMEKKLTAAANDGTEQKPSIPHTQENVFRHLMQKIKTLEMNYAIVEMYTTQTSDCYRSVLIDSLNSSGATASALKHQEAVWSNELQAQRQHMHEMKSFFNAIKNLTLYQKQALKSHLITDQTDEREYPAYKNKPPNVFYTKTADHAVDDMNAFGIYHHYDATDIIKNILFYFENMSERERSYALLIAVFGSIMSLLVAIVGIMISFFLYYSSVQIQQSIIMAKELSQNHDDNIHTTVSDTESEKNDGLVMRSTQIIPTSYHHLRHDDDADLSTNPIEPSSVRSVDFILNRQPYSDGYRYDQSDSSPRELTRLNIATIIPDFHCETSSFRDVSPSPRSAALPQPLSNEQKNKPTHQTSYGDSFGAMQMPVRNRGSSDSHSDRSQYGYESSEQFSNRRTVHVNGSMHSKQYSSSPKSPVAMTGY